MPGPQGGDGQQEPRDLPTGASAFRLGKAEFGSVEHFTEVST